ncbi:MAG: hypothetical protein Q7S00_04900, partial [bacterium]|nr:hypothetical protein [bacterium]
SFCILNTPPIVWQQSYLNWLEHEGGEVDHSDIKSHFLELVSRLAHFLKIPLPARMEDLEVYTCGDLSFLERLEDERIFGKRELGRIKKQIQASESYYIPREKIVYLANLSINHVAEEGVHYLRFLINGLEPQRKTVDRFYAEILQEAFGFFGSKILNHKRKCLHEKDYQRLVQYLQSIERNKKKEVELETALLVLDHRENDREGEPIAYQRFLSRPPEVFSGLARALGAMLGDKMYYALLEDRISKKELREAFRDPVRGEGEPFWAYLRLVHRVRGVKIPRRV